MPQDPPQKVSSALSETTVLWLGLTAAPVIYAFIAFSLRPGEPALSWPDLRNPAELALTLVAVVLLSHFPTRRRLSRPFEQ